MTPEKPKILAEKSFDGEIKTSDGKIRKKRFKARVLGFKHKGRLQPIERQTQDGEEGKESKEPVSQQKPLEELYTAGKLIKPPYDLDQLVALVEESNILQECLDAMAVNVEGFGHLFRPRSLTDEQLETLKSEVFAERAFLDAFFDTICSDYSFVECRKRMRRDLESLGNGYFEIVRSLNNLPSEILHLPGHTIRLSKQDKDFTEYEIHQVVPDGNGWKVRPVKRNKRFRRFVQVDDTGQKLVWFKEYGDPRVIDKRTGEVAEKTLKATNRATELKHFRIYSPRTPYGIPRHIGRYPSILGSRRSEEINYFTMGSNQVPSAFISVEDGTLTDDSVERLTEIVETSVGEDLNYAKFVILESEPDPDEAIPGSGGGSRIKIDSMAKIQIRDEMFQKYDLNNQNKIRRSWRLPPLIVGLAEDYTRATAQASRQVADEQVFAPERAPVDHWINQVIRGIGVKYHVFKSKTPNITDNSELVRAMGIAEKSGGMTPRRADVLLEDIFDGSLGPMPTDVDLDTPYSLQFALAQNAAKIQAAGGPEEVSREMDWVDEYLEEILRGDPDE